MKVTLQELRKIIREEMILESDADDDGRSDAQELQDIAKSMRAEEGEAAVSPEETPKRSWDLTEEELRDMSQEEYTNLLRAEAQARMAEDPGLSMSVVSEYDPTTPYFTEYENALEMERSQLSDAIEDVIKSSWGFKPRNYEKYSTMNLQQLRDLYHKEIQHASEQIEEEERHAKAWEPKPGWDPEEHYKSPHTKYEPWRREPKPGQEHMMTPEPGEEFPRHTGMSRRPGGRHGRGQLSESAGNRWQMLAGIKTEK